MCVLGSFPWLASSRAFTAAKLGTAKPMRRRSFIGWALGWVSLRVWVGRVTRCVRFPARRGAARWHCRGGGGGGAAGEGVVGSPVGLPRRR
jgi:hypothetical protein